MFDSLVDFAYRTFASGGEDVYTKLHDKWYDLSSFNHPGGPVALTAAAGRDATALYESHHAYYNRTKLNKILMKYEVKDGETIERLEKELAAEDRKGTPFVWANPPGLPPPSATRHDDADEDEVDVDAFGEDLRSLVTDYFRSEAAARGVSMFEATKATPRRWAEMAVCWVLQLSLLYAMIFHGSWIACLLFPFADWLAAVNTFHDGSHFAISTNWRINYLGMFHFGRAWYLSPTIWLHQHIIGHHNYSNIPHRDPDLYHAPKFMRHTKSLRWRSPHKHQTTWGTALAWSIGNAFGVGMYEPIVAINSKTFLRWVTMQKITSVHRVAHFAFRAFVLFYAYALWFFLFSPVKALFFAVYPALVFGWLFMMMTQINHLTPENTDRSSTNFFRHQAITSHTVAPESALVYYITGGLNLQIEHHLLPSINHCHLRALHPHIKALCIKHNVPYHQSATLGEALQKHWDHLSAMGPQAPERHMMEQSAKQK